MVTMALWRGRASRVAPLALVGVLLAACAAPSVPPVATGAGGAPTSLPTARPPAPSAAPIPPSPAPAQAAPSAAAVLTGTPIKLGVLDDITGNSANQGALMRVDVDMVVDQINSTGGINGHPVQPIFADPKGDPALALQLATQLVQNDNVDVLAGTILSPECQGVSGFAAKAKIVYLPLMACATDALTAKDCNRYTFRTWPVANQTAEPAAKFEVDNFGKNWGIIYPDYALGQSSVVANEAALKKAGGQLSVKIAVPLGEPNMTPYVTKVPTDGSIQGIYVASAGSDLARTISVMQQFGVTKKLQIVQQLGKESFGGVYPDGLTGSIVTGFRASDGIPGNQDDQNFLKNWLDWAHRDAQYMGPLGGVDKATPGPSNGYQGFVSMNALKLGMRAAGFTGKADTDKLITALENLTIPQGPDAPAGPMIMNKVDHQGRMTSYLLKINGQTEDIVAKFPAETLPMIGTCQVT